MRVGERLCFSVRVQCTRTSTCVETASANTLHNTSVRRCLLTILPARVRCRHLDALAWEGVERDQELEQEEPSSPAPSAEALADAFRALPKRLVDQAHAETLPAEEVAAPDFTVGCRGLSDVEVALGFVLSCALEVGCVRVEVGLWLGNDEEKTV